MTTPTLREALQLIADTDPIDATLDPQRAVRVARAALAQPVPDAPELDSHGRYWVQHRGAIIDAITRAGFHLMSDADGFWLSALKTAAAHPQQPAPQPLTPKADEMMAQARRECDDDYTKRGIFISGWIGAERSHGIVPAPTTDQSHPQR